MSVGHFGGSLQKDANGRLLISPNSVSAYGDAYDVEFIPKISGSSVYGFLPSNFRTFTASGGAAGVVDNMFECSTGTTQFAYGTIQSFRTLNYKVGQGAGCRFGAIFPSTPVAGVWIGVGLFNIGDEVSFGYNGVDFGTFHRHGGRAEVQHLQITGAAGGSETAAVTIDGTLYSIPITTGTVQHNAFEIAAYLEANIVGWEVEQLDDEVILVATSDGDKVGAFTFVSATATGAYTEVTAGVTKVSDFTAQSDWNAEVVAGFDPTKGNNYQILFKDGFGDIDYYIEDPTLGILVKVHTQHWGNLQTTANLHNPSLRMGCYAASIAATTDVKVRVTDMAAFVLGSDVRTRNPRGVDHTKSIGTTLTNLLTLRNAREYNGHVNQVEINPLSLSLSNDGTKTAIFELYAGATIGGETNFQAVGTNLVSELDIAGTTVTGGRFITAFTVAKGQSLPVDLKELQIAIPPTLTLTVAAKMASGTAADLSAALTYYEDV